MSDVPNWRKQTVEISTMMSKHLKQIGRKVSQIFRKSLIFTELVNIGWKITDALLSLKILSFQTRASSNLKFVEKT